MKKYSRIFLYLTLLSCLPLSSCNNDISILEINQEKSVNIGSKYLIQGKVNLSDFNNAKFTTKAINTEEISTKATVSLLYPSDYSVTELRNTAIAAGVTDELGNFKFNPSDNYKPKVDEVLVLEAGKRIGGIGNSLVSLRTLVKWNGLGWDSITKPSLYINKKTTALSIISNFVSSKLDPISFSSKDAIGRITVDTSGLSSIKYDEKLTSNAVNRILNAIDLLMFQNLDPLEHIYSNDEFYLGGNLGAKYDSSIKANMHTLQTIIETYGVDWGGVYSSNVSGLISEGQSKNYWKNFKNPFTNNTNEILDYDEYIKVKETLIYKDKPLENISELKGFIIYKPGKKFDAITQYVIYGLNSAGNFIVDNFGNDFYLSNQ